MKIEKERSMEDRMAVSSPSIPLDITTEILLRLPAKSIGRFRCVSKLWSSTTTTPGFVKSFSVHSSGRSSLLFFKNEGDKRVFYSLPHHRRHNDDPRAEKYHMMILPKEDDTDKFFTYRSDVPQSIHGLISCGNSESVIIWNPTLRQRVTVPEPPKVSKPFITLLGYDPVGGEHKVLCMSICEDARKKGEEHPQIITLGAQKWRTLIQNSLIDCELKSWRCIKGVVYYFTGHRTIVSFDVRSEKFGVIQMPEKVCRSILMGSGFVRHKGRLALYFNINCYASQIKLWVLEDAEKHEWSQEETSTLPFETNSIIAWKGTAARAISSLLITGQTDDDELIYLPTFTNGPFHAIYYDFESHTVRKVPYDGIGGEHEFRVQCFFPNHIESLVSLDNLLTKA